MRRSLRWIVAAAATPAAVFAVGHLLTNEAAAPDAARTAAAAAPAAASMTTTAGVSDADEVDAAGTDAGSVDAAAVDAAAVAVRLTPPPAGPPPGSEHCPASGHAAIVDRDAQRGWLCVDGVADAMFPITTALEQPRPGTYRVYAKDRVTTSTFGGHFSYLDHFVAFTRGIHTGARVAFHAVPRTASGARYQPLDSVGSLDRRGESSGCIRVLPEQAVVIWDHLRVGDTVVVIS